MNIDTKTEEFHHVHAAHCENGVTTALLRHHGLDFMTEVFMIEMQAAACESVPGCQSKELANSFKESYEITLQPYHNTFIRLIFKTALNAAPKRKNFYQALIGDHADSKTGDAVMNQWATSLKNIVTILKEFLASDEALSKWAKTKV